MSRPFGDDDRPFPLSGQESKRYGAIVTFENAAGRVLILHRAGGVRDAIDETFRVATALDPTFRVVSVSNPTTLYTDLQGARNPNTDGKHERGGQTPSIPELFLCGGKRRYMVHPRLRGSADANAKWRSTDAASPSPASSHNPS